MLARWVLTKMWSPDDAQVALEESLDGERPPRQRELMRPVWGEFFDQLFGSLDPPMLAQVAANAHQVSRAWLDAVPVVSSLELSDATVVAGLLQDFNFLQTSSLVHAQDAACYSHRLDTL
jgi:hypothetical protein